MPPTIHISPGNVRARSVALSKERLPAAIDLCVYVRPPHGNVRTSDSTAFQERFSRIFRKIERYSGLISGAARGSIGNSEGAGATASRRERPPASPGTRRTVAEVRERIDVWVNEGGAGGEVNR